MPTYSYRCTECGHAFDIQQAFSDDSLTECPNCRGPLRKIFSPVGVTFSGSGFYRTDSRAGAKDSSSKDSGSKDSGGTSTSTASSTPAPSAKPAAASSGSTSSTTSAT